MMVYPLLINGKEDGSLSVEEDGLYTRIEAWTAKSAGLTRVWIHGEGQSVYLGVLQPWSGGMYLKKKFSKSQLSRFPAKIELASDCPGEHTEKLESPPKEKASPLSTESGDGLLWYRRPDGSLAAFDGIGSLVALPVELRRGAAGAVLRQIDGKEYMVFRY